MPFDLFGIFHNELAAAWVQGIGSLAAVVVALWATYRQADGVERQRHEDRERAHQADRPLLVFALDQTVDFCRSNTVTIIRVLPDSSETMVYMEGLTIKPLPESVVRDVARCVASMPTQENATPLIDLLRALQVTAARLRYAMEARSVVGRYELSDRLYDLMLLQVRASNLFPYARYETRTARREMKSDQVAAAAVQNYMMREDPRFADFYFLLDKRADL